MQNHWLENEEGEIFVTKAFRQFHFPARSLCATIPFGRHVRENIILLSVKFMIVSVCVALVSASPLHTKKLMLLGYLFCSIRWAASCAKTPRVPFLDEGAPHVTPERRTKKSISPPRK